MGKSHDETYQRRIFDKMKKKKNIPHVVVVFSSNFALDVSINEFKLGVSTWFMIQIDRYSMCVCVCVRANSLHCTKYTDYGRLYYDWLFFFSSRYNYNIEIFLCPPTNYARCIFRILYVLSSKCYRGTCEKKKPNKTKH